jgi:hypothetical protein
MKLQAAFPIKKFHESERFRGKQNESASIHHMEDRSGSAGRPDELHPKGTTGMRSSKSFTQDHLRLSLIGNADSFPAWEVACMMNCLTIFSQKVTFITRQPTPSQ